jgi:predicted ABC-type ATPase
VDSPHLIVIAGPNGAGKSTTAPMLLRRSRGLEEFVNADVIAEGLSAYDPAGSRRSVLSAASSLEA